MLSRHRRGRAACECRGRAPQHLTSRPRGRAIDVRGRRGAPGRAPASSCLRVKLAAVAVGHPLDRVHRAARAPVALVALAGKPGIALRTRSGRAASARNGSAWRGCSRSSRIASTWRRTRYGAARHRRSGRARAPDVGCRAPPAPSRLHPDGRRDVHPRGIGLSLEPPEVDGRDGQRRVVKEGADCLDRLPGVPAELGRRVAGDVDAGRRQTRISEIPLEARVERRRGNAPRTRPTLPERGGLVSAPARAQRPPAWP